MRKPSEEETHAIRRVVAEVLNEVSATHRLTDPEQIVIAHYVGGKPTPYTPWPCMDALLVLCDHADATAIASAIALANELAGGGATEIT